ncbi:MAG TPA: hypothetical protein VGB52_04890 [Actinomycetota bacterium]
MRARRSVSAIFVLLSIVASGLGPAATSPVNAVMPVPAVVVLDPTGCNALQVIGNAGLRTYANPDGSVGWLALDSDGSKAADPNSCGTTAYTISFSTSTATAWACGTPFDLGDPAACAPGGVIESFAFDPGQTACLPATTNNACNPNHIASGQLRPTPIRATGRMTRAIADHEWNCKGAYPDYTPYGAGAPPVPIAPCAEATSPFIDQLTALVGTSGAPSGFTTTTDCAPASGTIFPAGNYFVDCATFTVNGDVTFEGGNIVFGGSVSVASGHLSINTANPNADVSSSCRRDADLTEACLAGSSQQASFIYLRGNGSLTKAPTAALTMNHVFAYLDPINPPSTGRKVDLSFGAGVLNWTAPEQLASPAPEDAGWFFDKLALWSEASNEHRLGGAATYTLRGVLVTPGALLNYTIGSDQLLEHAQFIAFRVAVAGPGILRLQPNPASTLVVLPEPPDTTITTAPPEISTSPDASISFEASSPASTFECSLDGAVFTACTSPLELSAPEGAHDVAVRAVDPWGQPDPTPAIVMWTIDLTPPTIIATIDPAANANGWWRTDPTVTFSCTDAAAGVASCTSPVTLTTEGAGHEVTGTAVDNAGHTADHNVTGINIDQTPPLLDGTPTTAPNAAGWYNTSVTVAWTSSDALSGIDPATDPADSIIDTEGAGLVAGASVLDLAGNVTPALSAPLNIDLTAPLTSATAPGGWNNDSVQVLLAASDGLSGVAETRFRLNGGAWQTGTSILIEDEGTHLLEYQSTDFADNLEQLRSVEILIDRTPPEITHLHDPAANAAGWNNTDVLITFACSDGLSGIAACTPPQLISGEGALQLVEGTATDLAGNTATDPATVSIDKAAPVITATADRAPNAAGWYDASVLVTFSCTDALSGITSCADAILLGEGADQSAAGAATDAAGNAAGTSLDGVNIDATPPVLEATILTAAAPSGWYVEPVTIQWSCSDPLSGIDGDCPADTVVTLEGNAVAVTETVADIAGNTTTLTVSGLQIDLTPPETLAAMPDPLPSGWHSGPVQVALTATDLASGVAATWYRLDGGTDVAYMTEFVVADGGEHELEFWSTDVAGNIETPTTVTIRIDDVPPTIELLERLPEPNEMGWNAGPVTVRWSCADAETDVVEAITQTTIETEGADQTAVGVCRDLAGNETSDALGGINIDTTGPAVTIESSIIAIGAITGTASDPLSGAQGLSVVYTDVLGGEQVVTADCVACTVAGTPAVAWTAPVPSLPGVYRIRVTGTDWTGNTGDQAVVEAILLVPALP